MLRHEGVHAFLSLADNAPFASIRQSIGLWGYKNSQLLRFTEEALAEGIATRSLWQGLRHPIVNPYNISVMHVGFEVVAVGAGLFGASYIGWWLGGGNE